MMPTFELDRAVQTLAQRIGRPIIVFDAEFGVAAFSVHEGPIDSPRLNMILTHHATERAAAMITEHHVNRAAGAVLLPVAAGFPSRIVAPLRYNGRLTGYVSYIPGDDDDPDARDAAEIVAARDDLGALLAAIEAGRKEGSDHVLQLISRLMDGQQDQREAAASDLVREGLVSSAPQYSVVVLRPVANVEPSSVVARLLIERVLREIAMTSSLRVVGTVLDDEGLLVLPSEVTSERFHRVLDDPVYANVRTGVGGPRARLADVRDSRHEARIAVRATTRDPSQYGSMAAWADLGLDRVLLQLPLERLALDDLPPAIATLIDDSSGPDLAHTLEAYLDNGADAQRTAQYLHIHRSTLYYRLDRIRLVIDADLGDGRVRRELHTGLRVATLAGLR
jgi:Regulator of polyketide synthase expression